MLEVGNVRVFGHAVVGVSVLQSVLDDPIALNSKSSRTSICFFRNRWISRGKQIRMARCLNDCLRSVIKSSTGFWLSVTHPKRVISPHRSTCFIQLVCVIQRLHDHRVLDIRGHLLLTTAGERVTYTSGAGSFVRS